MDDPRCFDARLIWYQCGDCGAKLQESQRRYHNNREHIDRPHDDAMTVAECAKVLGVTQWAVRNRIKGGRLEQYGEAPMKKGVRVWVLKASLQAYIRQVAAKPERMIRWANTGKL